MSSTKQPARPRFTSVKMYKHAAGHPSFWYPPEWQLQETDEPNPAVSLYPDPSDEATFVSVTVQDMGQPLAKEESSLLAEGIEEGLQQLDECVVEKLEDLVDVGDWGKEWVCTFLQDGATRRRRARLFCAEQLLYSVVVQGATNERYEYWKGMMEWVMLTVSNTTADMGP